MSITAESSLREVAFAVCTALHQAGSTAVLTGGSAATVYAEGAYQSRDLDFVLTVAAPGGAEVLAALGYRLVGNVYHHAANPLTLDFPPGPLMVGGEITRAWDTLHEGAALLHILKPTDCCRDRLAGFLFWNDRGSLAQALAVARAQRERIELPVIRAWCEREGQLEKFAEFVAAAE
ncbi:hypothetical protein FJ251_07900 [bacterium]|nr:hypothetical protein [bacterium]